MTEKSLLQFTCYDCSCQFTALGIRSHPVRFCPDCKKIHLRLHNQDNREYRAARHKRVYRLDSASYEVIRHDDPGGFRPGARFSGKVFKQLVSLGYVEEIIVRKKSKSGGGTFVVKGRELVEVRES